MPQVIAFDLLGTFVFALSGGVVARRTRLDLFGAFVVSFAAGTAGGMVRDVLIGTTPLALIDWRYAAVALGATALVALSPNLLTSSLWRPITILDAFGLGLFAVSGTWRAIDSALPTLSAILIGILTAVGGGVARDLLVARIPVVLRREVYALAAAAASVATLVADRVGAERAPAGTAAVLLAAAWRLLAAAKNWNLPKI